MSFSKLKTWDNRTSGSLLPNGKTWTRRITWLVGETLVKLKLEDGDAYREVLVDETSAKIVWQRFRDGQPINDAVSILGAEVPESLKSRRAAV
jgi:hypothetical protein